jgi:predicted helicase
MSGYIYIRKHESYEKYNVVKLGKAENIKSRETSYVTGEIKRGTYILVLEMEKEKIDIIEKRLQNYFKHYHYYEDGGVEFYKDSIVNEIVPFLSNTNLKFKVLSEQDLKSINRPIRKKIDTKKLIEYLYFEASKPLSPLSHQKEILDIIESFYEKNNIGKLLWACGLGKALTSILIVKKLKCKTVVVGLPSENLQQQFYNEILRVFPNKENILCIGGNDSDKDDIYSFYKKESNECKFFVTTYASCHYLNKEDLTFDFKIGDEAHHLTGKSSSAKDFKNFHKIQSRKTLYLTATEKIIDSSDSETIYSMDNEEQFGVVIDTKSVKWAIENKKITDYQVLILQNNEEEINSIIERLNVRISDKNLFISAFMSLKSIEKYKDLTHIVLYTNKTVNSDLVKDYIEKILNLNVLKIDKSKFYNNSLHSNNAKNLKEEIKKFKESSYGIISCVYIFGEGFDLPKLNGVSICRKYGIYYTDCSVGFTTKSFR